MAAHVAITAIRLDHGRSILLIESLPVLDAPESSEGAQGRQPSPTNYIGAIPSSASLGVATRHIRAPDARSHANRRVERLVELGRRVELDPVASAPDDGMPESG